MTATVGNTGLQVDTFISKSKNGIEEVGINPPVIGSPSLCLRINQEILKDRDKQKALERVNKKKELQPIMDLLKDDIILEEPILAHKLLRSNMITISEPDLMAWSPTL